MIGKPAPNPSQTKILESEVCTATTILAQEMALEDRKNQERRIYERQLR